MGKGVTKRYDALQAAFRHYKGKLASKEDVIELSRSQKQSVQQMADGPDKVKRLGEVANMAMNSIRSINVDIAAAEKDAKTKQKELAEHFSKKPDKEKNDPKYKDLKAFMLEVETTLGPAWK